jgi:hypothetical protein
MPEIVLTEDILQIIWKKVFSNYVVSSISKHATRINKNLQIFCDYVYLDRYERLQLFQAHLQNFTEL